MTANINTLVVAGAIVIATFIGAVMYYAAEEKKTEAIIMSACISRGGSFYISWNWKPVCKLEATK